MIVGGSTNLEPRLSIPDFVSQLWNFSPKLRDKIWNRKPGFKARVALYCSVLLQPFLVGKAVVPLQRWLAAPSFNSQCHLDVRSSTLARGVSEDDPIVGKLEVHG